MKKQLLSCVTSLRADMWLWLTAFRTALTASPSDPETSFSCRGKTTRAAGEFSAMVRSRPAVKSERTPEGVFSQEKRQTVEVDLDEASCEKLCCCRVAPLQVSLTSPHLWGWWGTWAGDRKASWPLPICSWSWETAVGDAPSDCEVRRDDSWASLNFLEFDFFLDNSQCFPPGGGNLKTRKLSSP